MHELLREATPTVVLKIICSRNSKKRKLHFYAYEHAFRSSRSLMFFKIGALKRFTGKHLCWNPYLIKLRTATLFKRDCSTNDFL